MRYANNTPQRKVVSLLELHTMIRESLQATFPDSCWVRAEMSDVRVNVSSGHCYLEFIEKDAKTGQTVAKARGTIWARTFQVIKPYFEKETKQAFASGLKVLVNVSVEFHELYGYSLSVYDIDPSFTVGDLIRKRAEVIRRLQEEGIFNLNRELPFPLLPQRIAVITSPTAAGYEDFIRQLTDNDYQYVFYIKLFPAVMQGEKTGESIVAALDKIFPYTDFFDVVVIIRGGGSTSELNSFDTYPLAAHCAQFPLPVITGIGHERDDTVVDMVAHTRMKTPTAVAAFLIECISREAVRLQKAEKAIFDRVNRQISQEKSALQLLSAKLTVTVTTQIERHRKQLSKVATVMSSLPLWIRHRAEKLDELPLRLQRAADTMLLKRLTWVNELPERLRRALQTFTAKCRQSLELNEQYITMVSPENILKRGYTLTCKKDKIVKYATDLAAGDEITIKFTDGEKKGTIMN